MYVNANGNNFWGIDPHVDPRDGSTIILASDRDSGLWIFRYTGRDADEVENITFLEGNSNLGDAVKLDKSANP